jgi:hypothetical protein
MVSTFNMVPNCLSCYSIHGSSLISFNESLFFTPISMFILITSKHLCSTIRRYPIYHIPMGRTIKDLSTCFLTYHTLSSSFQGTFSSPILWSSPRELRICWLISLFSTRLMYVYAFRYGRRRWHWESGKEAKGRGKHHSPSIWFGHLQDARERVGLRQLRSGPR